MLQRLALVPFSPHHNTNTNPFVFFSDVRAGNGNHFERAVRLPEDAFHGLVRVLGPRLPRRRLYTEVRTAPGLRYLGGESQHLGLIRGREGEAAQSGRGGGWGSLRHAELHAVSLVSCGMWVACCSGQRRVWP